MKDELFFIGIWSFIFMCLLWIFLLALAKYVGNAPPIVNEICWSHGVIEYKAEALPETIIEDQNGCHFEDKDGRKFQCDRCQEGI